jgi:hypothetical protein
MKVPKWRVAAGIAVLVLLVLIGLRLTPPYVENFQFQGFLNSLLADPASANRPVDQITGQIVAKASSLGLPVKPEDVHITRTANEFKIEVLYLVRIDLQAYSVDLHFRPTAGGA